MDRISTVTKVHAKSSGVINVFPDGYPYFEPHRIQFRSFDCTGRTFDDLDFKIGAAVVGGSPQMSINTLTPNEGSLGISSKDLDAINWAVFSTAGLARELQICVYNPHETDLLIYTCVEGRSVPSLNCYASSPGETAAKNAEALIVECSHCGASAGSPCRPSGKGSRSKNRGKPLKHPHRARKEAMLAQRVTADPDTEKAEESVVATQISSETIEIAPRGQRGVQIISSVAPYFRPSKSRVHAAINQTEVPIVVVDILCGRQSILGGIFQALERLEDPGQPRLDDGPYEAMSRLRKYIVLMERDGLAGIERNRIEQAKNAPIPEANGIPSSLLETSGGWHDVSSMPVFSTSGLGRPCHYLLYNPWPFTARVSVTVSGTPMYEG